MLKLTTVITGSSSGIGRAIAEKLLSLDHTVVGMARQHAKFQPKSRNYIPVTIDFSSANNAATLKEIHYSHRDINILILSAGFGIFKNIDNFSMAEINQLMQVNFIAQVEVIKEFLPSLKKNINSKIIVIGSESAQYAAKMGSIYCASKFALRGFCQALRQECAKSGVAVTQIHPGFVATPFFDKLNFRPGSSSNNVIEPRQIAELIANIILTQNNCVLEEVTLQPAVKVVHRV